MELSVEAFDEEMKQAVEAYEKYIVCIRKTPDEFRNSLKRLMGKALKAYVTRGAGLRHGIALDREMTIILSQTETERPLCGIYFNLHSPYSR